MCLVLLFEAEAQQTVVPWKARRRVIITVCNTKIRMGRDGIPCLILSRYYSSLTIKSRTLLFLLFQLYYYKISVLVLERDGTRRDPCNKNWTGQDIRYAISRTRSWSCPVLPCSTGHDQSGAVVLNRGETIVSPRELNVYIITCWASCYLIICTSLKQIISTEAKPLLYR